MDRAKGSNQSLHQEILPLQKFDDIRGKVLKLKKSASNLRKKIEANFWWTDISNPRTKPAGLDF